jgi:hypothetical protein
VNVPVVVALTEPVTVTVVVAPELVTAEAPGSTYPVPLMLQRKTLVLTSPFRVMTGEVVAVVVPVEVAVCVITSEVDELTFPAASVAVRKKVVVVPVGRLSNKDQLPVAEVVAEAVVEVPLPVIRSIAEPASAVPVTTTALEVVV